LVERGPSALLWGPIECDGAEVTAGTGPLTPSDALLWRIEADPVLRSPVVAVGILDRSADGTAVVEALERAVEAIPRLRCRIAGGAGGPQWEIDPGFHLEHHLRRARAVTDGGRRGLLAIAEADAAEGFEPTRPPWTFTLVDDNDGGPPGFVLRFHHAISDGVGAVDLAGHLFDRTRSGGRSAPPTPAPPDPTKRGIPELAATVAGGAGSVVRAGLDPVGTTRRALRFGRSVTRLLGTAPDPLSPLWLDRSLERSLHTLEVPLDQLRAAAEAANGTINDVFLGAVAGGAHRYHEAAGVALPALRFTVPINLRREGDPAAGNHFTPARFVLAVDDPDPVHRARLAGAVVRRWRAEPAVGATSAIAAILDRLPTAALVALFGGMLRGIDIDASNIPGVDRPAYFAGSRVDRLWAFAPLAGAALSATLLSHGTHACIGIECDTAAVADPPLLARGIEAALHEALAGTTVDAPHLVEAR
jgi:WS/DGAT/MGAT family acyltransferase